MEKQGEIILYQPDEAVRLEVRLEDETVWLTQAQIAELFQRDRTVITKHINNVFKEKELEEKSNVHFLHIANSDKPVKFFSLDVIISVGYRVKSVRGTQFRQWANKILKEYLLKGYSINQRLNDMEYRMNNRFFQIEKTIAEHDAKIDFFVRTSLPPVEGIFFDGQIFDAYKFATDLIKSAKCSLVLIDNYVHQQIKRKRLPKPKRKKKNGRYTGKQKNMKRLGRKSSRAPRRKCRKCTFSKHNDPSVQYSVSI